MSSFTPSNTFDTPEKDWQANLGERSTSLSFKSLNDISGMLDWDSTKIVFTKRQLIEFLK